MFVPMSMLGAIVTQRNIDGYCLFLESILYRIVFMYLLNCMYIYYYVMI